MDLIIAWHLVYLLLAAHFYLWDSKPGTGLRGAFVTWHNWTHSKAKRIDESTERGFVYEQTVKEQLIFAVFFAVVLSVLTLWLPSTSALPIEVLTILTKIVAVFIGFRLGPLLLLLYSKIGVLAQQVDDAEKAEQLEEKTAEQAAEEPTEQAPQATDESKPSNEKDDDYYLNKLDKFGK